MESLIFIIIFTRRLIDDGRIGLVLYIKTISVSLDILRGAARNRGLNVLLLLRLYFHLCLSVWCFSSYAITLILGVWGFRIFTGSSCTILTQRSQNDFLSYLNKVLLLSLEIRPIILALDGSLLHSSNFHDHFRFLRKWPIGC